MSISPVSSQQARTPLPTSEAVLALEEITKAFEELGYSFSKRYEEYSELQIAILNRDVPKIKQFFQESIIQENTMPPCLLAYSMGMAETHSAIFAHLFQRASDENQVFLLAALMGDKKEAAFAQAWQVTNPSAKGAFLARWNKDPALIDTLFQQADPDVQKEALAAALINEREPQFCRFWQQADRRVLAPDKKPWICEAIRYQCVPIISFLLESGVTVQTFDSYGTVLERAEDTRSVIGEEIVAQIAQLDQGFTKEMVHCQLFGHAFNLKGDIFEGIQAKRKQSFINFIVTFLEQQKNLYRYSQNPIFSPDVIETMRLSTRSADELVERVQDKWVLVQSGWKGHSVACLFSKELCIKIDTSAPHGGIYFYRIGNQEKSALQEAMQGLIDLPAKTQEQGLRYFGQGLNQNLRLEFIGFVPYQQKGGHCTWYAQKAALCTLVLLKQLEGKAIDLESIAEAWGRAEISFNGLFEEDCREQLMQQTLPLLQKHQNIFSIKTIFADLVQTCAEEYQIEPILEWIRQIPAYATWRHPITGQSIPQLFLRKTNYIDTSILKMGSCTGIDFESRDNQNRSCYDDFQAIPINDLYLYEAMLQSDLSSNQKSRALNQRKRPSIAKFFTGYRHPESGKPLTLIALEDRSFYVAGLLHFLGCDLSTLEIEDQTVALFSDPKTRQELYSKVMEYPLSEPQILSLKQFIQSFEERCLRKNTASCSSVQAAIVPKHSNPNFL